MQEQKQNFPLAWKWLSAALCWWLSTLQVAKKQLQVAKDYKAYHYAL